NCPELVATLQALAELYVRIEASDYSLLDQQEILLRRALAILEHEKTPDLKQRAACLCDLSLVLGKKGQATEAAALAESALRIGKQLKDQKAIVNATLCLDMLDWQKGDYRRLPKNGPDPHDVFRFGSNPAASAMAPFSLKQIFEQTQQDYVSQSARQA